MSKFEEFAASIDSYIKNNADIQPEDKNMLVIDLNVLLDLVYNAISSDQEKIKTLETKIRITKDVLDL